MKRLILFLLILCSTFAANSANLQFYAISDIHFDPFFGCHLKKYCNTVLDLTQAPPTQWDYILKKNSRQQHGKPLFKVDTNHKLLLKTISSLSAHAKKDTPAFAVITGDFVGHSLKENYQRYFGNEKGYPTFVRKLFQYLIIKLHKALPKSTPIYFVMGNNDGYLGDYIANGGGQFFKDIANDWPALRQQLPKPQSANSLLEQTGSYAVKYKSDLKLIFLNSNLFNQKTQGKTRRHYANLVMAWFAKQLEIAKTQRRKVLVFYHIPYGLHPINRLVSGSHASLWDPELHQTFFKLSQQFKNEIIGIIHGHLHRHFLMRLHIDKTHKIKQRLVNSVSPILGNKASFSIFTFDTGKLKQQQVLIK